MNDYDYETIDITNDFMFGYVMSEPNRCRQFLEQILDIQIDHVEYLEKQKTIDLKIDAKSIRLDLYMGDGKTVFNVEMQNTTKDHLPKRSRYYQGQIDMSQIVKGESYKKIKKNFVIFICTFDPFHQNRYIYSFENICRDEDGVDDILLKDETYKIFINTKGEKGQVSDNFKELMDYFNDPQTAKTSKNPLVSSIDAAVREARNNEKWRHDYMTWQMYGNEKYDEGMEKGMEEGHKSGLIDGRAEERKMIALQMQKEGFSMEIMAKILQLSESSVEQLLL